MAPGTTEVLDRSLHVDPTTSCINHGEGTETSKGMKLNARYARQTARQVEVTARDAELFSKSAYRDINGQKGLVHANKLGGCHMVNGRGSINGDESTNRVTH